MDVKQYVGVAETILEETSSLPEIFDQLLLSDVVRQTDEVGLIREKRCALLIDFLTEVLAIFRETVLEGRNGEIHSYLLNDSKDSIGDEFYKALPDCVWHIPQFFRTDESGTGEVFEIQCPGSGWGELPLLSKIYERMGIYSASATSENYVSRLVRGLSAAAGVESPTVLHLLDNSSNPSSMRYLMRLTQPPIKYVGHTRGLKTLDAQLVRSHSVQGLIAENLFKVRLGRVASGACRFDLPPLMIFDQKTMLTLPFLDSTKDRFSENVRRSLVYSYPLSETGFRDVDGRWCSVADFLARSPRNRRYYLKYGGCDTSINWGGRAVYALDGSDAAGLISSAIVDARMNRPWIIQPAVGGKSTVNYFDGRSGIIGNGTMSAKFSSFYGPLGLIGVRAQYRKGTKVHGQSDTVCGLVV